MPPLGKSPNLYLVTLGGKVRHSNIEQHDIRWVVGSDISDTYSQLRHQWFGEQKGLHIDSYMKIKYIDGYSISLSKDNYLGATKATAEINSNKLWFVNLGGYHSSSILELHQIYLIVANSYNQAKSQALHRCKDLDFLKHNDNLHLCKPYYLVDQCNKLSKVYNWNIEINKDYKNRSQLIKPDWFGYKRIDFHDQLNLSN